MTYPLLLYVHVLLFVFWIGTDVGVFVLGRIAQSPRHSLERRLDSFETALKLDRSPRLCFALMLPVGLTLAIEGGLVTPPPAVLPTVWAMAAAWIVAVVASFVLSPSLAFDAARGIDRLIQLCVLCVTGAVALGVPMFGAVGEIRWLAWKVTAFAILSLAALVLDFRSTALLHLFETMRAEGAGPALQRRIDAEFTRVYALVLALYLCALTAAFCGITKLPA